MYIGLNTVTCGQKRSFNEEALCHEQIDFIYTLKGPLMSYMVHLGHEKQVLSDDDTVLLI